MFCPQCGTTQADELNFCKKCGANLSVVKTALANPSAVQENAGRSSGLETTWVGEMFMSRHEKDRVRGVTPEQKRIREVKAGIITAGAGLALTIVLAVLMGAIIASGVNPRAIPILSSLWIVGLIPILVGSALILNGLVISKMGTDRSESKPEPAPGVATGPLEPPPLELPTPATTHFTDQSPFSVTDETTRQLEPAVRKTSE